MSYGNHQSRSRMSKKDYIAIAAAVREHAAPCRQELIKALARIFRADNERFDYNRFEEACNE